MANITNLNRLRIVACRFRRSEGSSYENGLIISWNAGKDILIDQQGELVNYSFGSYERIEDLNINWLPTEVR